MARALAVLVLISCAQVACFARGVMVDPRFAYYKERTPESIVEEVKANEFDEVHLCCAAEASIDPAIVKAFADAHIKVWLVTSLNGTTSTADLPKGWESWRMILRRAQGDAPGGTLTYLCPNSPAYREWKKQQIVAALAANPFTGIDLTEPGFPAYLGPESEEYGCLCDSCAAAFFRWGSGETASVPNFADKDSPRYWKTDTALYEKWVGFRVAAVVDWLDEIVNGKGGIREKCPNVKVATWGLALDAPDQLAKLREWQAIDGAAIVRRVKPDVHVVQTSRAEWSKPELFSDYPGRYKPAIDSIREVAPSLPVILQADVGSVEACRRGRQWVKDAEDAAKKARFESLLCYEYQLGDASYTDPPALVRSTVEPDSVTLVFSKRLDSSVASNISSYSLTSGRVDFARVDGNVVRLSVSGLATGSVLTITGLTDDPQRRLFRDKPACPIVDAIQVTLDQPPAE